MIITKEYLNSIRPSIKGKSDKYSWYIYRYLSKKLNHDVVIYKCDNEDNRNSYIFGELLEQYNLLYGFTLFTLVTSGKYEYVCSYNLDDYDNFEPYDEWFSQYAKIGRCRYIEHCESWIKDGDTRFNYINDHTRTCNWCGHTEHKVIKKVVSYEELWR